MKRDNISHSYSKQRHLLFVWAPSDIGFNISDTADKTAELATEYATFITSLFACSSPLFQPYHPSPILTCPRFVSYTI